MMKDLIRVIEDLEYEEWVEKRDLFLSEQDVIGTDLDFAEFIVEGRR